MRRGTTRRASLLIGLVLVIGGCSERSPVSPAPVCTVSITPSSAAVGVDGGNGSITVTTAAGCAWAVTGGGAWLTVTSASSGTGPATITYTAVANPDRDARSAALVISGQTHTVNQPGRPAPACAYQLTPDRADSGHDAGTGTLTVTAAEGCGWTASTTDAWVLITGVGTGTGNGTVTYAFTRNSNIGERLATIRVADRTFTLRQSGDNGQCEYLVAPVDLNACMPAGTLTATITTQPSCPWTAESDAPWMTLQGGGSGSGSGIISFAFSENYDAPRTGTIRVRWPTPTAGQNIRFGQAGCLYAVTRSSFSFTAAAGAGTFDVIQQSDPNACGGATQDRCIWSAVSDVPWITVTGSMPRSGDNPVSFTVAPNSGAGPRTGRITVRDKVVVVTQAGA